MADPYIGQIICFAGSYAPRNWAICNGQLLMVQENQALFSIIGKTYGGNGITTFALPDLRGRIAIGSGSAPGLTTRKVGQTGGTETVGLTGQQTPAHTHTAYAVPEATQAGPESTMMWGGSAVGGVPLFSNGPANCTLAIRAVGIAGGLASGAGGLEVAEPHDNMPPYFAAVYLICTNGLWPQRP